jgi:hypothetical protein
VTRLDSALRILADSLPAGAVVSVPRDCVVAKLTDTVAGSNNTSSISHAASSASELLTAKEAARRLGMSTQMGLPSCVARPAAVRAAGWLAIAPVRHGETRAMG